LPEEQYTAVNNQSALGFRVYYAPDESEQIDLVVTTAAEFAPKEPLEEPKLKLDAK
jgi:hypothetical protein